MLFGLIQRLPSIARFDDFDIRIQVTQHLLQRFQNQRMVIHDEDLHSSASQFCIA
jgi:hypothetical protein